jgi:ArsR family transcriptional regulator
MVNLLLNRDYCVGGLARTLGISEAAVSQHLKVLKDTGIVRGVKHGYFMHYQVERNVLNGLAEALQVMTETPRDETGSCRPRAPEECELCGRVMCD